VTIDKRQLLQQWANCRAAQKSQFLPPEIRAKYKKAGDLASMALGMMRAKERRLNSQSAAGTPPAPEK